jgi:ribosome biogenesis GTPase A
MGFWPVVENVLMNSDIVLLVSDVRMPELSRNSELERKIEKHRKIGIQIFTKIDLVSKEFLDEKRKEYPRAFFISATKNRGVKELRRHLHITAKKMKLEKPRIGVVGYPNIGKSALINVLARRAKTLVADKPGTTRGTQWVDAGGLRILDSPGVVPYEDKGSKLVLIGSKSPDNFSDPEKAAFDIIRMLVGKNRSIIENRYKIKIEPLTDPGKILLAIGKKRGFLKKGGIVDETKTSIAIIRDWQKGKLIL